MAILKDAHPEKIAQFEHEFAAQAIAKLISSKNGASVADIGCSYGNSTIFFAKNIPNAHIVGVEIDSAAVEGAREKFKGEQNLKFVQGDARETGLPRESLDAILCCQVIEHLNKEDQAKAINEFKKILKPGGVLVISTPDRFILELQGTAGLQPNHVRELSRDEFEELLKSHGFSIVGVYGQGLLKNEGQSGMRKFLNVLKRYDVFKIRRIRLLKGVVDTLDTKTQPIDLDSYPRQLLKREEHALNLIIVSQKPLGQ
ncbi:MAG: hypothetical protein A3B25_02225 [Candidatus Ryanbacteria bacterium RIFCSPLOWO2_01_FULL_48_26]|uniref:Methyltransferase domain-containing protein n=1 Tax=Candidatus Ryanbacteria bacterium RIFCSPLOWO2_01_FULL_48_26 TaxID=1802126 RepID=A0A1G2GT96_9BACT|nr:MAG: hypothetical protein A3B25_02225 [Candidatus Ryanbacteria bacterium RIFCSPLOWO2_01_FULL_48_26]OHB23071.1 MAG: hypothetical protein A3J67_02135 [Parcubacteria group bacterium RIFCSPHIGHO2_02_FULL_48_10b]